MEEVFNTIFNFISSKGYGTISTIVIIILAIISIYNKLKYQCLEKVSNFVAEVEKNTELSGEQKFEMCKLWLSNEVKVTNSSILTKFVEKIIQYAYDTSKNYAINYIARKANVDVSKVNEVISELKQVAESTSNN